MLSAPSANHSSSATGQTRPVAWWIWARLARKRRREHLDPVKAVRSRSAVSGLVGAIVLVGALVLILATRAAAATYATSVSPDPFFYPETQQLVTGCTSPPEVSPSVSR